MNDALNSQQLEACHKTEGPLLILAGAGTGKTKVLTHRMAHIIGNGLAYPSQILAVTFTNKAANEMLHRTEQLVQSSGIWIGTFHSLATRIIRNHTEDLKISKDFTIIDVDDQWRLLKKIIHEKKLDEKQFSPKILASIIGKWKDLGLFPQDLNASDLKDYFHIKAKDIYNEYQNRLKLLSALDFGDLLLFSIKLFKENPNILSIYQDKFRYVMVDEYQDTNVIQYLWLRYLVQKHNNICAVGDEDQSIYGWRGAEIRNIMKFTHDFKNSEIVRLEQNYRSTNYILATANQLISNNKMRMGKNLWTEQNSAEKVYLITHNNAYKEAEYIAQKIKFLPSDISRNDIAILVRASFQTRVIEDALIQNQIHYKIVGGLKFYDRLEIKNCLAYIRLSYNTNDSLAFERIINSPKRGIGPSTISQIQSYANNNQCSYFEATKNMLTHQLFKGKTYISLNDFVNKVESWNQYWNHLSPKEASENILNESGYIESLKLESSLESESRLDNISELLRNIEEFEEIGQFIEHVSLVNELESNDNNNVVKVMTIHAAKGLEFSLVFLPGWEEGIFPSKRSVEESENGLEEERRLAYVAITRAKKNLFISHANSRQTFGEWQYNPPSRFIKEIEDLESVIKSSNEPNYTQKYNSWSSNSSSTFIPRKIHNEEINQEIDDKEIFVGKIVEHPKFGKGRVLSISGQNIDIFFENYGKKKIMKEFIK